MRICCSSCKGLQVLALPSLKMPSGSPPPGKRTMLRPGRGLREPRKVQVLRPTLPAAVAPPLLLPLLLLSMCALHLDGAVLTTSTWVKIDVLLGLYYEKEHGKQSSNSSGGGCLGVVGRRRSLCRGGGRRLRHLLGRLERYVALIAAPPVEGARHHGAPNLEVALNCK